MTGKKGFSGRRKQAASLIKEAVNKAESHLPELFDDLIQEAHKGNWQAAVYLINRVMGMPKAHTDVSVTEGIGELNWVRMAIELSKMPKLGEGDATKQTEG